MSDLDLARNDPRKQLFEQLDGHTAGMLGVSGSGQHMQPMSHFTDPSGGALFFFTSRQTDLFAAMGAGAEAHYTYVGEDHDYHACMRGRLSEETDPALKEKYWNSVVAAWLGEKDDPEVALLRFQLKDAAIWASTSSTVRFGWEILRSNVSDEHQPDVGVTNHVNFA
ncbi:pyridoxamine 5'-phosphate oxidase family protein [Roseobacter sp. HKCCA0434]|uniref:pyridoxamine 5'-phosphate oxidase family protein n=1 Tax=Roseobacter sp. HKCCA0434 TaxID=3079297 RepID=UPI002905DC13|nr:pyridoxamine 5'-phosphate oxidase family protein [Roseobacter sp. HKCCA0434]